MATTAKINREKSTTKLKFTNRKHNRCSICGRPRGYMRLFGLCRLCFRRIASNGEIPGVKKASW